MQGNTTQKDQQTRSTENGEQISDTRTTKPGSTYEWLDMHKEAFNFCIMNNKQIDEQREVGSTNIRRQEETGYGRLVKEKLEICKAERGVELTGSRKQMIIGKGYPDQ